MGQILQPTGIPYSALVTDPASTSSTAPATPAMVQARLAQAVGTGGQFNIVTTQLSGGFQRTNSTSFLSTGFSVTITPSATSSTILLFFHVNVVGRDNGFAYYQISSSGPPPNVAHADFKIVAGTYSYTGMSIVKEDVPATISPVTYTLYMCNTSGGDVNIGDTDNYHTISGQFIALEIPQ